jgi:hypothetical protein
MSIHIRNKEPSMVEETSPFAEQEVPSVEVEPVVPTEPVKPTSAPVGYVVRPRSGPVLGGLVLVALGVIMLLRNLGTDLPLLRNWWALFILIPAVQSFDRARRIYRRNGSRVTDDAMWAFIGALALTMVAVTFLFGLSWSIAWPVFLILAGLGALVTASRSGREP